jgi:hypothetical protein
LKLSQIKNQIDYIKICKNNLPQESDNIIHCRDCGDLKEISTNLNDIRMKKKDIIKNLGSIVDRYMEKLDSLYSIEDVKGEYKRHQTFDKYTELHYPDLVDKARKLAAIVRYDWGANSDELMDLIGDLNIVIDKFITIEEPKEKPIEKQKRTISLNKVINVISRNLALSGYNNMTITQFENELRKELEKIKNEYDEIIVNQS